MVITLGSEIVDAYTNGVKVIEIYSNGVKVWPTSTPYPANNEIYYTTTTGNVISPLTNDTDFGANLISNTVHSSGNYCVLTFDGPVLNSGIDSFKDKNSLLSITLPSSVTTISTRSFYRASGLVSVEMGDNVTIIEPFAFERTSLTHIRISNRCTVFGRDGLGSCFEGCTGLTSVIIPSSVIRMFPSIFKNCSNLSEVIVNATTPPELLISMTDEYTQFLNCSPNLLIKVPSGSVNTYKNTAGWSSYASQIVSQ